MISPELLLEAYRSGLFPMGVEHGEILWFSPDPRGVIPLSKFHTPHGLKRLLRKTEFRVSYSRAFEIVIRECADRSDTWITPEIVDTYCLLHRLGYAHSVEVWSGDDLAGGLYGVALRGAFFGESMFHRESNASKVALFHLVRRLKERRYVLLDTQWSTPHLEQFGAIEIPRACYLELLAAGMERECRFL